VDPRVINGLLEGNLTVQYHHVLPRDQAAVVDEVVKLLSTPVPAISLETSQEVLGRGMSEVTRIISMMADHPEWFEKAVALASAGTDKVAQSEKDKTENGGEKQMPKKMMETK
jgi:hypothetical protein